MSSCLVLSSCVSTKVEYVVRTPTIIPTPQPPATIPLDATKSLQHPDNFKALQLNMSMLKNYINNLKAVVIYYEDSIKELNPEQ